MLVALLGCQEPRLSTMPDGDATRGDEAVAFARFCGLTLYPWQEDLLRDMCRVDLDYDRWAAREVVVSIARQNGKGEVILARELAGIYLFGEKSILHTAHLMDTAVDAQKRLFTVIEDSPDLMGWWAGQEGLPSNAPPVPTMSKTNGKENITFPNGAQILFRTRTVKTGRGLPVDYLIIDECFALPNEIYSAISKTVRARKHAQTLFISSPVNRFEHMHGAVFSAKRWAGIDGSPRMLFREWSPEDGDDPLDIETWRRCNPSLVDDGEGAQLVDVETEAQAAQRSDVLMQSFLIETLGQGNWYPRGDEVDEIVHVMDRDEWGASVSHSPRVTGDSCMGIAVAPEGTGAAIVAAMRTRSGVHLSLSPVAEFDRDEVVRTTVASVEGNDPLAVVLDAKGVGAALVDPLTKAGVEPEPIQWANVSTACETMLTLFREGRLTNDGDPRWVEAINVAEFRQGRRGDRAFKDTAPVVSVLVAASFAIWGLIEFEIPDEVSDVKKIRRYVGNAKSIPAVGAGAFAQSIQF